MPDREAPDIRASRGPVAALEKRLGETLGLSLFACAPEGIVKRLRYRFEDRAFTGLEAYAEHLLYEPGSLAWYDLVETLTRNESEIFGGPEDFTPLFDGAFDPETRVRAGAPFRCLSAGCGTGEEAYSLAVALAEAKARSPAFAFEVVGVDLSARAIQSARQGHYPTARTASIQEALRARYFEDREGLCVPEPLKPHVRFARLNLCATDSLLPLGAFALVFARGFLGSLTLEGRRQALLNLSHALAPGGVLLLGPEDSVGSQDLGLLPIAWGNRFAYQMADPEGPPLPEAKCLPEEGRVLVAHRSPAVRGWIRILLEERGLVVDEAAHGIEALERAVVGNPPARYLLERTLPPRGGAWVYERLARQARATPAAVFYLAPGSPQKNERPRSAKKGAPPAEPLEVAFPLAVGDLTPVFARKTP